MKRTALVVLGMHRSGTSALTGTLVRLGVSPPRNLIPANEHNPAGHWEPLLFNRFHERMLAASGGQWSDWDPFDASWLHSQAAAKFEQEFVEILEQEFGDATLFVAKDPRISRFAPFWFDRLRALDIAAAAVICVRNPLDVARSLISRDGIGLERGLLIWLRHMLDAEHSTRKVPRVLVQYDALLAGWREVAHQISATLRIQWPMAPDRVASQIDGFLDAGLRHHAAQQQTLQGDPRVAKWVRDALAALEALCRTPDDARAMQALDAIKLRFDEYCHIFAPISRELASKADARRSTPGQTHFIEVRRAAKSDFITDFGIDSPQADAREQSPAFEVRGWVLGAGTYVAKRVEVRCSGRLLDSTPVSAPREDVATKFPEHPNAPACGFTATALVSALPEEFLLTIATVLVDKRGGGATEQRFVEIRGLRSR